MKSTDPSGVEKAKQSDQLGLMDELVDTLERQRHLLPPRFNEFAGLMRLYTMICRRTHDAGGGFNEPASQDQELAAMPSDIKYLELKLQRIFGPVAQVSVRAK